MIDFLLREFSPSQNKTVSDFKRSERKIFKTHSRNMLWTERGRVGRKESKPLTGGDLEGKSHSGRREFGNFYVFLIGVREYQGKWYGHFEKDIPFTTRPAWLAHSHTQMHAHGMALDSDRGAMTEAVLYW